MSPFHWMTLVKATVPLAYLRQLPVDTIKIDQAFVIDMFRFPNNLSILEGWWRFWDVRPGIIAEGVETTMHGKYLIHLGCINAGLWLPNLCREQIFLSGCSNGSPI